MKEGDWNCPSCGDHQFARNSHCRQCGAAKDGGPACKWCAKGECWTHGKGKSKGKGGSGDTPAFDLLSSLLGLGGGGCGKAGGKGNGGDADMMPGDWNCPNCGDHQFAKNATCRQCGAPNPNGGGTAWGPGKPQNKAKKSPGDWNCPQCGDHQFARNSTCRKCGTMKPAEGSESFIRCKWCDLGECWDHGPLAQAAKGGKGGKGFTPY